MPKRIQEIKTSELERAAKYANAEAEKRGVDPSEFVLVFDEDGNFFQVSWRDRWEQAFGCLNE